MAATTTMLSADVPQVPGHPILGNLPDFRRDRAGMLLRIGKSHPDIARIRIGFFRNVMVLGAPAYAHEVLTVKEPAFVKAPGLAVFLRPVLGNGLLTSEGSFHTRQRRLLAPAFAAKRISAYAATMGESADRFARGLRQGVIDVSDAMMHLTFEIVGKTLFDAEVRSDASDVGRALTVAMEVSMDQLTSVVPMPPKVPTPANLRYRRAVQRLDELVYGLVRERRAEGKDRGDVLSMLLAARDEDGSQMDDRQVRDESMTLFLAGHETTANALSWTFLLLAQNPDVRTKMEVEIDALGRTPTYEDLKALPYTLAVFKEAMRLYPPAYLLARRAVAETSVGGVTIKPNGIVIVNTIGIHRRPDLYPDPEAFRPERFLGDAEKNLPRCAYLPFGAGPRVCIGNHFAVMEGHVLLAAIARRVRFELAGVVPKMEPLVTLRPRGGLPMRALPRD